MAAIVVLWLSWEQGWGVRLGVFLICAIFYIPLAIHHNRLSHAKDCEELHQKLCHDELNGLNYNFSAFDGAPDEINQDHSFTLDLDIYGTDSLFQSINRTVTHPGKAMLIDWLDHPLSDKDSILCRQAAIRELSEKTPLRQEFFVQGMLNKGGADDAGMLTRLSQMPVFFANHIFWQLSVWFIPALWLGALAGLAAGWLPYQALGPCALLGAVIAYSKVKQIGRLHHIVNQAERILKSYARLMECIEQARFSSELLLKIRQQLVCGKISSSEAVRQLSAHISILDQRGTFTAVLLNIFNLREIRAAIAIERWSMTFGTQMESWFDALARFDALSSLAGFAFNHPDYVFPVIVDSYFCMKGRQVGHPLLHRDTCVRNDIQIDRSPSFMIVTGANMAGKSTYLRTVGVNFLLAKIGAPVCAENMEVYPAQLVTSLRTSDSLTGHESYFFAELKRLKMIIDRLQAGEELFIILDEILKGTNSADKQKGSIALMKQLVSHKTCGIIATHDLAVGSLEKEFPEEIGNYCFEADICEDRIVFTYLLRKGIAQNMTASFLMRQMGITLE